MAITKVPSHLMTKGAYALGEAAATYVGDIDAVDFTSLMYCETASTNRPTSSNGYLETIARGDDYAIQRFTPYNDTAVYVRRRVAGTWTAWTSPGGLGFLATKSASQTPATGSPEQITFDTESFDDYGNFASNAFTCEHAGHYLIGGSALITGGTDTQTLYLYLRVGATDVALDYQKEVGTDASLRVTAVVNLSAGDVVTLWVNVGAGGTVANSAGTRFWGVRL